MLFIEFIYDDLDVGVESHTMEDARKIYEIARMSLPKGLRAASPGPSTSIGDGTVTPAVVAPIALVGPHAPASFEHLSISRPSQLLDEPTYDDEEEETESDQENNGLNPENSHDLGS